MQLSEVTVIVPVRNEAKNITRFLGSVPPAVPLIAIDAGQDETAEIIRRNHPHNTRVIQHPGNISVARQLGAEQAATPWLLFTDADIHFAADYFSRVSAARGDADLIYGPKLSHGAHAEYYARIANGQGAMQKLGIPAVSGSNLLIKRSVLFACGGFDSQLNVNEDTELGYRVARQGYEVRFAPDLIVYSHDNRRLFRGTWRKTLHSVARCTLLYLDLMPERWRRHDWGYWKKRQHSEELGLES